MLKTRKPGSVVVDLAVEAGGNCAGAVAGKIVTKHGVKIVGHVNVPGRIPEDASKLFARNLLNFLSPMIDEETGSLKIDAEDEIVAGTLVTRDGKVVHPDLGGAAAPAKKGAKEKDETAKNENTPGDDASESDASAEAAKAEGD